MMQGAAGTTLREMSSVLLLPQRENTLPTLLKQMRESNSEKIQLLAANKMFARKTFRVYPNFQNYAQEYEADIENIDFNNR